MTVYRVDISNVRAYCIVEHCGLCASKESIDWTLEAWLILLADRLPWYSPGCSGQYQGKRRTIENGVFL